MQWSDAWYHGMRRRVRWHRAAIVWGALVAVVLVGANVLVMTLLTEAARRSGLPGATQGLAVVLGAPVVIVVLTLIYTATRLRREQLTLRMVPAHDGMVCPHCRRALSVHGDRASCGRCKREYTATQVREDWAQYPHVKPSLWQPQSLASDRLRTLIWSIRNRPLHGALLSLVLWLVAIGWYAWVSELGLFLSTIRMSYLLVFLLSVQLIAMGAKRRVGDSTHCSKCDYERAPAGGSASCPECGLNWDERGAVVRGRVTRSPKLIVAGAGLMAVYMVMFLAGERARGVAPTWMLFAEAAATQAAGRSSYEIWPILSTRSLGPEDQQRLTGLLIDEIIAGPRGFVTREWALLSGRQLTAAQQQRLFEGLIGKHKTRGYLTAEDRAWMESMIADRAVPADLAEQYSAGP